MNRILGTFLRLSGTALLTLAQTPVLAAVEQEASIKFAFYSSAWGENTDDGLRLLAYNRTENPIRLHSITFLEQEGDTGGLDIALNIEVPALGYAELEIDYIDLLLGDECIERTMADNWKLVEISNYTLNPSVRNLIIEDTDSFRIYQCEQSIDANWQDLVTDEIFHYRGWVLYHFENRRDF